MEVAGILSNLGLVYSSQGLYRKAEPLLKRSLKISEINLDPNNRETSYRLTNLAQLYEDQGLFHKSAKLLERGLRIEFLFIQRETPYLALSQRQSFLQSLGRDYESSFLFAFS